MAHDVAAKDQGADSLRLTIELVPETCWNANVRSVLTPAAWDKVRRQVYAAYDYRCGICGGEGNLHCHEVWSYDDERHVQTLAGFIALCEWCHHVKHIGYAGILASAGKLDYERVVGHFLQVNGCDRAVFQRHYERAFEQWRERSRYEWQTDLGPFNPPAPPAASDSC